MARDRQRAKERRASPVGRHRADRACPDASPRRSERGAHGHRLPDTGAAGPVDGDVDADVDETIDLVEAEEEAAEAAPDSRSGRHRGGSRRSGIRAARGVGSFTFLGHVIDELRRVIWPDRRHVAQGTAVVLGFVVIAGTYLGLMDAIWKPLIEAIL